MEPMRSASEASDVLVFNVAIYLFVFWLLFTLNVSRGTKEIEEIEEDRHQGNDIGSTNEKAITL